MAEAFDAVRRPYSPAAAAARPGRPAPSRSGPGAGEVETLISRAQGHALGLDFLLRGAHDAVAVTFGVHAFVVDAARDHLRSVGGGEAR